MDPRTTAQPTMRDLTASSGTGLIATGKVAGTNVYGADDANIGSIEDVMLDKTSGKVAYAVLSFGGFLGIGSKHYPLPWSMLHYDTRLEGYVVNLVKDRLENAPVVEDRWYDRTQAVDEYWARAIY